LAKSVVTLAELRLGYRLARWGSRRISETESWFAAFARIGIDGEEADEWSKVAAAARARSVAPPV
jgi:predicted nucleic acid-binding protein